MPKCQIVNPEDARKSGQIEFKPIPVNQYNTPVKDELKRYSKEDMIRIQRDMVIIRTFENMLNEINGALDEYATQRKRLALALAAGQMEGRMYSEADGEILSRVSQLQAERSQLVRRQVQRVAPDVRLRSLNAVRELLRRGMETADPQMVNVLLHEAGVRIHVEDGEVTKVGLYESPSL